MYIFFTIGCIPKSEKNDSNSLLLLGALALANGSSEDLACQNKTLTWTARSAAEANDWRAVTYAKGIYVALSLTGTNQIMISQDGITWKAQSAPEQIGWRSITFGKKTFVAVAFYGPSKVMTASCE